MVGNGTGGEIVKGILGGAGVLGAADTLSGGGVGKGMRATGKYTSEKWHKARGHEQGVGPNKEKTWQKPEEYTKEGWVKNEKSGMWELPDNQRNFDKSVGPSNIAETSPQTAETPHPTTNNMTAQTSAVNMESSLNDFHNSSTSVLETQVLGADGRPARESLKTSSMRDSIAEVGAKIEHGGNKVTKTLGAAMVGLAGMSLFPSDAEAKTLNDIKPNAAASALMPVDTKGFSEIAGEIRRRGYFFLTCKRLIAQFY